MNENIAFYETWEHPRRALHLTFKWFSIVKKIYILEPHPLTQPHFMDIFLHHATQRPEELETLHLDKKTSEMELRHAKKRFQMMKCKKCRVGFLIQSDISVTFFSTSTSGTCSLNTTSTWLLIGIRCSPTLTTRSIWLLTESGNARLCWRVSSTRSWELCDWLPNCLFFCFKSFITGTNAKT